MMLDVSRQPRTEDDPEWMTTSAQVLTVGGPVVGRCVQQRIDRITAQCSKHCSLHFLLIRVYQCSSYSLVLVLE